MTSFATTLALTAALAAAPITPTATTTTTHPPVLSLRQAVAEATRPDRAVAAMRASSPRTQTPATPQRPPKTASDRIWNGILGGVIGLAGGALAGGAIGSVFLSGCKNGYRCQDDGMGVLAGVVFGSEVGGLLGIVIGASRN